MPNHRITKKHMRKNYIHQFHEMKRCMERQEEMMNELIEQLNRQKEILNLYYKEYQELKRHQEKQYLMTYIRMRESMLRDMKFMNRDNKPILRDIACFPCMLMNIRTCWKRGVWRLWNVRLKKYLTLRFRSLLSVLMLAEQKMIM